MLFAIVDIETTGSYAAGAGITEIAIVVHDGHEELHRWQTLVNPQRHIPRLIQQLTGISNEMVGNAPPFEEIAAHVHELLHDKVFVAHNVNFDFSFIKLNLERCGYKIDSSRKLCTVRLARKVIPGHKSYSLGKICTALSIEHVDHHRAMGDAAATTRLFEMLVERDETGIIPGMLKGRNREQYLPPNVPVEQLDSLPECPGVYYFYNSAGKIIYVGKAVNIHQRVKSHFSNNKTNKQKADFLRETYRISYVCTGTDLMAQVLESVEIRRLWPLYNRSQRGYLPKFGLFAYEDRQGFTRLALDKSKQHFKPLHTFNTITEGTRWLRQLTEEFGLCARLCNLAKTADCSNGVPADTCTGTCPGHEDPQAYNDKVLEAMSWMKRSLPTLAVIDTGRHEDECSCILIERGEFAAMGYLDAVDPESSPELLKTKLELYPDNDYIRGLVYRHVSQYPLKCFRWDESGEEPRWLSARERPMIEAVVLGELAEEFSEPDALWAE